MQCPFCFFTHHNFNSLRVHASKMHKMKSEELYVSVYLLGIKPSCLCGCGETPRFSGAKHGYNSFIRGHSARVKNNWGHNLAALQNSIQKRRELWKSGILTNWCKGLTKKDPRIALLIK